MSAILKLPVKQSLPKKGHIIGKYDVQEKTEIKNIKNALKTCAQELFSTFLREGVGLRLVAYIAHFVHYIILFFKYHKRNCGDLPGVLARTDFFLTNPYYIHLPPHPILCNTFYLYTMPAMHCSDRRDKYFPLSCVPREMNIIIFTFPSL